MRKLNRLPVILAALSLGAELALNLFGSNSNFVLLWLAIAFLFVQVVILYVELEGIKNVRPNLEVFGMPYGDTRPLVQQRPGDQPTITDINCFHLSFANNPKNRVEQATARKVFAQLTYYGPSRKKLVGPINGRWGDTEQPGTRSLFSPNRDLLSVDFESSGLSHELNLAIKHPQEKTIYAFNNDSYPYPGWRNPAFAIKSNKIVIRVRLSGENVDDKDWWVLLESRRNSQTISLTEPLDLSEEAASL